MLYPDKHKTAVNACITAVCFKNRLPRAGFAHGGGMMAAFLLDCIKATVRACLGFETSANGFPHQNLAGGAGCRYPHRCTVASKGDIPCETRVSLVNPIFTSHDTYAYNDKRSAGELRGTLPRSIGRHAANQPLRCPWLPIPCRSSSITKQACS